MMRFYFHVREHGDLTCDDKGTELPGVRAALQEAQDAARKILARKVLLDEVIDGQEFEVCDELGKRLFNLPFKSVLRLD
jgi:hypothetical protein